MLTLNRMPAHRAFAIPNPGLLRWTVQKDDHTGKQQRDSDEIATKG